MMPRISSCMSQSRSTSKPKRMASKVKRSMCHILIGCFFCAALPCLLMIYAPMAIAQTTVGLEQRFANSLTAMPSENLGVSGAFYVPVYSSVSMSQGKLRANFSVTLSIHNSSEARPLVLRRIAYFDTAGKLVETETVLNNRSLRSGFRRSRRNRRQLCGGLGCCRRNRRTRGRGADVWRPRQRPLCVR